MAAEEIAAQVRAAIRGEQEDLERLRSLTLEERGELIAAACRAAMQLEQARLAAGLPPSQPAPWPASTREFLRRCAAGESPPFRE